MLRLDVPGRLTLSLGAALTAGTLGILAAQGMGLTETFPTAEIATPAPQTWDEPVAHPSFGRTEEATPSSPVTEPPPAVVAPGPEPAPTADPAPTPTPAADTAALPTVRQGDPCPTEGANGLTAKGRPVTCSSGPGGGPTRWRRA